jgi:hypothetical protein
VLHLFSDREDKALLDMPYETYMCSIIALGNLEAAASTASCVNSARCIPRAVSPLDAERLLVRADEVREAACSVLLTGAGRAGRERERRVVEDEADLWALEAARAGELLPDHLRREGDLLARAECAGWARRPAWGERLLVVHESECGEREVDGGIVTKLEDEGVRAVREGLDEVRDVERAERGAHCAREAVGECTPHEQVELVLEVVELGRGERSAPRRALVGSVVVRTRVKRAVDVVGREVDAGNELVEPSRDRREVLRAPRDREIIPVCVLPRWAGVHGRDPGRRHTVLCNRAECSRVKTGPGPAEVAVGEPLRRFDHAVLSAREDGGRVQVRVPKPVLDAGVEQLLAARRRQVVRAEGRRISILEEGERRRQLRLRDCGRVVRECSDETGDGGKLRAEGVT